MKVLFYSRQGLCTTFCLLTALIFLSIQTNAQRTLHLPDHEDEGYYFGISLGYNRSSFRLAHRNDFLRQNNLLAANPVFAGGISLGFIAHLRLNRHFELRTNPQLFFSEKTIQYQLQFPDRTLDEAATTTKRTESVIISLPLHLKLNSDRIDNFSFYVFTGGKLDYDVGSNARKSGAADQIKLQKTDYGMETGVGFQFYRESFIFTPEIRISHGFRDIHFKDPNLKYSNILESLHSRMIIFCIHLQGNLRQVFSRD